VRRRAAAAAALLALAGCAAASRVPTSHDLSVFAAASLGGVLPAVESGFRTNHPGLTFTTSTGSSAAVATQIEQGAPADVFLSADESSAQRLIDDRLVEGGLVAFATNHLVVIAPAGNPAGISTPADLARRGLKVVAAGDAVPITRYATEVIAALGRLPGYPADFAASYRANVVSEEDDVSGIVTKVSLGEADAGIVYATDAARAAGSVVEIKLPDAADVVAVYAGVALKGATDPGLAAGLLSWLIGPDGRDVLSGFGFGPPP
jgi:molybdate transport system substrate-binding protein